MANAVLQNVYSNNINPIIYGVAAAVSHCTTNVITAAGTVFAISAVLPATHDQAGFEALPFTDIAELVDGGSAGKTFNKVDHSPLGEREVLSLKGSFGQGIRTLQLGRDVIDPGQIVLLAALELDEPFSFRITFQNGDIIFLTATVDSYTDDISTIDSIVSSTVAIAQCNPSIRVNSGDVNNGVLTAGIDDAGVYVGDGSFTATQTSTTGDGSGVEFTVTITGGVVVSIDSVDTAGSLYDIGDFITVAIVGPTETSPAIFEVLTLGTPT